MPKKPSKTAQTVPHNCITFDDGSGHRWHVPFDEAGSVPRVGEEILLPNPPWADKRHSVVGVVYQFVQREVPEGAPGISLRGGRKSTVCASLRCDGNDSPKLVVRLVRGLC
jgi:hypothetical protein